jgi:hypothetical protein
LAARGVAVWNIEYRRVNGAGGWPTTLTAAVHGDTDRTEFTDATSPAWALARAAILDHVQYQR